MTARQRGECSGHHQQICRDFVIRESPSRSVVDVVLDEGLLSQAELDRLLEPDAMTRPSRAPPRA